MPNLLGWTGEDDAISGSRLSLRGWWCVAGGFCAAVAAASLLGALPVHGKPSLMPLLLRSVWLVLAPTLVGAVITCGLLSRFAEADSAELSFLQIVLCCGVGLVLSSPVVLLAERNSLWAPLMMMGAAILTAYSLHGLANPAGAERAELQAGETEPFSILPTSNPGIWLALTVAAGLECATVPFATGEMFLAGLLLALASFVFLWRLLSGMSIEVARDRDRQHTAKTRALWCCAAAILATTITFAGQLPHDLFAAHAGHKGRGNSAKATEDEGEQRESVMGSGYRGIVLWTPTKKKEAIVAPARLDTTRFGVSNRRPLVIPFDGPYWYFQLPHDNPGVNPHVSHGEPTGINIRSVDELPLLMEAHEKLVSPIDLECCEALEVDIKNGDNMPGGIAIAVTLTDSLTRGRPSLGLGAQRVISSENAAFAIKSTPVEERLRFAIPARRDLRQFDEITVMFFPPSERSMIGLKIAVEQFVLLPR